MSAKIMEEDEREISYDFLYNSPDGEICDPEKELKLFLSNNQTNFDVLKSQAQSYDLEINERLKSCQANKTEELSRENLALKEKLIKLKLTGKYIESETHMLEEKIVETKQEAEEISEEMQLIISEISESSLEINEKIEKMTSKYNAYNFAGKYFKYFFKIYIEVEENESLIVVRVYFFTTGPKNKSHSAKLQKIKIDSRWKLEDTIPKLPADQLKTLRDQLAITNNVIATICSVRRNFKLLLGY